jgi:hypothetical protein
MYVPAAQDVQLLFPVTFLYLPGTHSEHGPPFAPVAPALQVHAVTTELDTAEFELSVHATQTSDAFAPTIPEYVPAPQLVQAAVPFTTLYFPVAHNEHVPPFGPVDPALHTHIPITLLPAPETVFPGQLRHALAPVTSEYVPATQLVHIVEEFAPVSTEYVPALQFTHTLAPVETEYMPTRQLMHTTEELAPVTPEYVPAVQFAHTADEFAPVTLEYLPDAQFVHTTDPGVIEYVPAAHNTHTPLTVK